MDQRSTALILLLAFIALTGASIAVSGSRPHLDQGTAHWLLQVIGYLCALAGGVRLLAPATDDADGGGDRRIGTVVVVALVALVLIDAVTLAADSGGANIGAGFVRLMVLASALGLGSRLLDNDGPAEIPHVRSDAEHPPRVAIVLRRGDAPRR